MTLYFRSWESPVWCCGVAAQFLKASYAKYVFVDTLPDFNGDKTVFCLLLLPLGLTKELRTAFRRIPEELYAYLLWPCTLAPPVFALYCWFAVRCVEFTVDLFVELFLASVDPPVQDLLLITARFELRLLSRGGMTNFYCAAGGEMGIVTWSKVRSNWTPLGRLITPHASYDTACCYLL